MNRTLPLLLVLLVTGSAARAQTAAAPPAAVDAYNGEFQRAWDRLLPPLRAHLVRTATQQLEAVRYQTKSRRARVRRVRRSA